MCNACALRTRCNAAKARCQPIPNDHGVRYFRLIMCIRQGKPDLHRGRRKWAKPWPKKSNHYPAGPRSNTVPQSMHLQTSAPSSSRSRPVHSSSNSRPACRGRPSLRVQAIASPLRPAEARPAEAVERQSVHISSHDEASTSTSSYDGVQVGACQISLRGLSDHGGPGRRCPAAASFQAPLAAPSAVTHTAK